MCTEAALVQGGERFGPYGMSGHGFIPRIDRIVAPGEEVTVEAIFDPNAHGPAGLGRADRVIYVQTGARGGLQLRFVANVVP